MLEEKYNISKCVVQNDAVKKFMGQSKRINREDINCNFTKDK